MMVTKTQCLRKGGTEIQLRQTPCTEKTLSSPLQWLIWSLKLCWTLAPNVFCLCVAVFKVFPSLTATFSPSISAKSPTRLKCDHLEQILAGTSGNPSWSSDCWCKEMNSKFSRKLHKVSIRSPLEYSLPYSLHTRLKVIPTFLYFLMIELIYQIYKQSAKQVNLGTHGPCANPSKLPDCSQLGKMLLVREHRI